MDDDAAAPRRAAAGHMVRIRRACRGATLLPSSTVDLVAFDLEAARLEARLGLRAVPLEEDLLGLARFLELAQGVVHHLLEAGLALPDADGQRLGAEVLLEHHVLRLLRAQLGVAVEQRGL